MSTKKEFLKKHLSDVENKHHNDDIDSRKPMTTKQTTKTKCWTCKQGAIYDNDVLIAEVKSGKDSHILSSRMIGGSEADRNSRLIASAPELLEACRNALSDISQGCLENAKEELRKAIVKAIGGESK